MKYILVLVVAVMVSKSCVDDNDFFSLIDTWENPPRKIDPPPLPLKMPTKKLSDGCETHIFITFNKDLTGNLNRNRICADYVLVDFEWNIKGDELTIFFEQDLENNWDIIAGTNTFDISGNILTIMNKNRIISKLSSYNTTN